MGMLMSVSLDGTFAQPGFESRRCWQCRADPCKRAATNRKRALLFQTFKNPRRGLTVTLNCDTEMLLGCTLRRTHCLMSEAKRRGSDERSHFSFRVHLQREKKTQKKTLLLFMVVCKWTPSGRLRCVFEKQWRLYMWKWSGAVGKVLMSGIHG